MNYFNKQATILILMIDIKLKKISFKQLINLVNQKNKLIWKDPTNIQIDNKDKIQKYLIIRIY